MTSDAARKIAGAAVIQIRLLTDACTARRVLLEPAPMSANGTAACPAGT